MVKIIKKASKKNTAKPEEIKPESVESKAEFTFEAKGKIKEEFDKAETVIKGVEATSLLFLRSQWLGKLIEKGKKIFPFLININLKKIEERVVSFFTICIRLFSVATATFLIVASLRGIFNETYSIEPLKVPESFVQDGLDGQEVTSRLLQSVQNIINIAQRNPKIKYDFSKEIAHEDVVIMGISLNSIKQLVRSSMGIQNKTISGGIVKREEELEISLRVSGLNKSFTPIIVKFESGKLYKAFDELIKESAIQLLEKTEPVIASYFYLNEEKYDKVKTLAIAIKESDSKYDKINGYFLHGFLLQKEHEYTGAIEQYKKVIELNPENFLAIANIGASLAAIEDYKGAIEQYKRATELNQNLDFAYFGIGFALSALGDKKGAIEQFKKAIELFPEDANVYLYLGDELFNLGNNKEAIEQYKKAIELNPKKASAYLYMGDALFKLGDKKGAIEQYKKTIELDSKNANAYLSMGYALSNLGDKKEAIEQFKKTIELDPKNANAYLNLGYALFRSGNNKAAIEQYKKTTELDPKNALGYANLGYVLFKLSNRKEAMEQFQKAIKLEPTETFNSFSSDISDSIKLDGGVSKEREIFYEFLELSLQNKIDIDISKKPYSFYFKEKRFKDLMKRYSIK